jgi:cullin-4
LIPKLNFFLIISKSKEKPKLPENYSTQTWDRLREAVIAIQNSEPVSTSFEELYQAVENLCSHKMAPDLYKQLESLVEIHVKNCILQFLNAEMDHLSFLKLMNKCWRSHCDQMVCYYFYY